MTEFTPHVCLPLYRADDGNFTRCWCGADCREHPMLPAASATVIDLASHRDLLRANKTAIGGWTPGSVA